MDKVNNFTFNEPESKKYRHLMASFYQLIAPGCSLHYMDGNSYFEQFVQRKLDIDLLLRDSQGELESYEEKLAAWPSDDEPHSAICFETESNSNPGSLKKGWGYTCEASHLIYIFEILPLELLDILHIPFQKLKTYFWDEFKKNPRRFAPFRMPDRNRSQGRLINIGEISQCIEGTKRYHLHFDGACEEVDMRMSLTLLLKKKAHGTKERRS